ncbi:hypothetical protein STCU_11534 [Strigomonas culicis]|uniref:G domain-containing protein n=1 Tax=Strigomonas culicis TaxID=28005 RepID=S9TIG8_9TRYP|nr:hypothetical protein STCU_11534 [Strigomonas culicis]|eukprot:EPY16133.1 hypothetical protein STCU_11534 [Strigomonas culicis]
MSASLRSGSGMPHLALSPRGRAPRLLPSPRDGREDARLTSSYGGMIVRQASTSSLQQMATGMVSLAKLNDSHVKLRDPTLNILVLGAPQVGKSMFINAFRTAVTNNAKWPSAAVGICGFYGTTTVEPFPNHPTEPTWLCIDTPGRFYEPRDKPVLEKLVAGIPWKTKLAGVKAMTANEVEDLTPIAANKAHQCVIVVPANDLIEDLGWSNSLLWRNRYAPACDAENVVFYCKSLVSTLRGLLDDNSPFFLISKMDKIGGADNWEARHAINTLMSQCVPSNRIYYGAFPEERATIATGRRMELDSSTRDGLLHLHEDLCLSVQWNKRIDTM